ncbi:MAG TPA: ribulose-phosphate 3-epimerase [Rhodospirillaceae bacterium]|jgi:ribulose-phosphate 3-epimerase|nr:ribulose-phosphate 3-epimerase [Alphaproteobacteria bacterium]HBH26330.1 ribulose-phosphate 3-epimerase [Rhodospirillaceae bacterium]
MPAARPVRIAPSLLSADFAALGEAARAMEAAGADALHVDVMDGHFVPNITIGPGVVAALRRASALPLDVHLMIAPADPFIEVFAAAGADILTVHPEAGPHLHRTLQSIRARGVKAGVALNPATPVSALDHVLGLVDMVLVMTVNPGFGGQAFLPLTDKIQAVRARIGDATLAVDGGITADTAPRVIEAGADWLVAGTAAFAGGPGSYAANIRALRGVA